MPFFIKWGIVRSAIFYNQMLSGLNGNIIAVTETSVQIEAGFFHLTVLCPRTITTMVKPGEAIFLHTHLHVREDDLALFGFETKSGLQLFRHLISVSGIGPKIALEILAAGEAAVCSALIQEDVAFMTSIKGIGKKTAERAVLELSEKVQDVAIHSDSATDKNRKNSAVINEEIVMALEGLGWKRNEIIRRLSELPPELNKAEDAVKWFLTNS
jgi:Holliday junction DNA helicase RuvA